MDYSLRVEIRSSTNNLSEEELSFDFLKDTSSLHEIIQSDLSTFLEENINVLFILKEVLEPDDVLMAESFMNLHFAHQLLLSS